MFGINNFDQRIIWVTTYCETFLLSVVIEKFVLTFFKDAIVNIHSKLFAPICRPSIEQAEFIIKHLEQFTMFLWSFRWNFCATWLNENTCKIMQ